MKHARLFVVLAVLIVARVVAADPMVFTDDLIGDYTGSDICEIYAIGSKVEDGKLYFEIRTDVPKYSFWGYDGRANTYFSPGDVYIAVGTDDPFDTAGAAVYGIASTRHTNVVRQAYPCQTWQRVEKGRLYTNADFADGTYEKYEYSLIQDGKTYAPNDQDGSICVNSYPTLIRYYDQEISGRSSLSYSSADWCDPWDYEITGWVELDAIGLGCGTDYTIFFAPECGNDGAEHSGCIPCPPGELKIVKFNDLDEDGVRDCGEDLLFGWEFLVEGPAGYSQTVVTQADGWVLLDGLEPGSYTITETLRQDWEVTTPNPLYATVLAGEQATVEFGNVEADNGNGGQPPIAEPASASMLLMGLLIARRRRK